MMEIVINDDSGKLAAMIPVNLSNDSGKPEQ